MIILAFAIFSLENIKNKVTHYLKCFYPGQQKKIAGQNLLFGKNITNLRFSQYEHIVRPRLLEKAFYKCMNIIGFIWGSYKDPK